MQVWRQTSGLLHNSGVVRPVAYIFGFRPTRRSLHSQAFKIRDALQLGAQELANCEDVGDPLAESQILLAHVLKAEDRTLVSKRDHILIDEEKSHFQRLLQRRRQNEPMSYILELQEFFSLPFKVTKDVLIPRPDTETLVETAAKLFPSDMKINALDLGTGSGCILLSILKQFPNANGVGVDISAEALKVASENAANLGISSRVTFFQSDWLDSHPKHGTFDLLVSNPPYIGLKEAPSIPTTVKDFEPHQALFAGQDGLDAYRALHRSLGNKSHVMKLGSYLLLEAGCSQKEQVRQIFHNAWGLRFERAVRDLGDIERCLVFRKHSTTP